MNNTNREIFLCSDSFNISIDSETGYTMEIINSKDNIKMNWILEDSDWGYVDGFVTNSVCPDGKGVVIISTNEKETLSLITEKYIENGKYTERYTVENHGDIEFFLTRDNFGIHFPYNCDFSSRENLLDNCCNTHVWCGEDVSWLYSVRPNGKKPYLVSYVTEGSFCDYSILCDGSRVKTGALYRGIIVMHPSNYIISPEGTVTFTFSYSFSGHKPDEYLAEFTNAMRVFADKYTAYAGEKIKCGFESAFEWDTIKIEADNKKIPYVKNNRTAQWELSFDTTGERQIYIYVNEQKTVMRINIIENINNILEKRVHYICDKQQYHLENSHLDGAFLIYDRITEAQYYNRAFCDNNAARERLSMGAIMAIQLNRKYDDKLMTSLIKHRLFVERELYNSETNEVFNDVKKASVNRAYNYPWMSVYYLEWYNVTREISCLENAAKIMLKYYSVIGDTGQGSPCVEIFEIYRKLDYENMYDLRDKIKQAFLQYVKSLAENCDKFYSEEVSCTQGQFLINVISFCQAYQITNDQKYLEPAYKLLSYVDAFAGQQPDFHVNSIAVRYWDLYWFGKSKTYGDSMPQWLSALAGLMYAILNQCDGNPCYEQIADRILRNNLCVFSPDGFGSAGYLAPYKVIQLRSDSSDSRSDCIPGITYGKRYDDWANDQDWALYYAIKYLK